MVGRIERQRARPAAAEAEVFAHDGMTAWFEPLVAADPPLTSRVVRCERGPATVLLHGGDMAATVWAPLLPHLPAQFMVDCLGADWPIRSATPAWISPDTMARSWGRYSTPSGSSVRDRRQLVGWHGRVAVHLCQPERATALSLVSAPHLALPGARVPFESLGSNRRLERLMTPRRPVRRRG